MNSNLDFCIPNRDDSSSHARLTESAILNPQFFPGKLRTCVLNPEGKPPSGDSIVETCTLRLRLSGETLRIIAKSSPLKKPTRWGTHSRTLNKDGFAATLSACSGHSKVSFEKSGPRHEPKIVNQPPTLVHSSAPKCLSVNPAVRRKPYFSDALMSNVL